jgi:hypothetical protein
LKVEDRRSMGRNNTLSGLDGELSITIPSDVVDLEMAFLLELEEGVEGVEPKITEDGTALSWRGEEGEEKNWYWFIAPLLSDTSHRIAYEFSLEGGAGVNGRLSCWLVMRRERKGIHLAIPGFTGGLDSRPGPAIDPGIFRSVECLFDRPVGY